MDIVGRDVLCHSGGKLRGDYICYTSCHPPIAANGERKQQLVPRLVPAIFEIGSNISLQKHNISARVNMAEWRSI